MLDVVHKCLNLDAESIAFLKTIEQQMRIVADLSRADFLLYGRLSAKEAIVLSHVRPHSLAHVYLKGREGVIVTARRRPEVLRALISGTPQGQTRSTISEGAPVIRQTWPIYYPNPFSYRQPETSARKKPRVIAALVAVTNLIEYERHRHRSKVYQRALKRLQTMLLYGQVHGAETLSPFGEQDGLLFVDNNGIVRYASGVGANLFRKIGYREALVGRPLSAFETDTEALRREAVTRQQCLERESEENDRIWISKAVPLVAYSWLFSPMLWPWVKNFSPLSPRSRPYGVIFAIHDATEERRQDQEIRVKNAMIQEVHHRVKNNLQTIAGLLRMQARRVQSDEARQALEEALSRILSVAVIHEFLSSESSSIINIKDVCQRIITQFQYGMLSPEQDIRLELNGDKVYLPARQATACSLIVNELLQNSLEHGFARKKSGFIRLNLADTGDEVIINVVDNGEGLPKEFDIEQSGSMGLQIIKTLVEGDLRGQLQLGPNPDTEGLSVTIKFPKSIFRGEEGWKEHESS
ncbi:MAG: hypothetical protein D6784_18310 [Chloroflexi bacterium]|nr:MAG: hypothetical protein D6784_18310 [Chloroflexota bacterium]